MAQFNNCPRARDYETAVELINESKVGVSGFVGFATCLLGENGTRSAAMPRQREADVFIIRLLRARAHAVQFKEKRTEGFLMPVRWVCFSFLPSSGLSIIGNPSVIFQRDFARRIFDGNSSSLRRNFFAFSRLRPDGSHRAREKTFARHVSRMTCIAGDTVPRDNGL